MSKVRERAPQVTCRPGLTALVALVAGASSGCSLLFPFVATEGGGTEDRDGGLDGDGDADADGEGDADSDGDGDGDAEGDGDLGGGAADLGGTEIVATLVQQIDTATSRSTCLTAPDLAPGAYWDLGGNAFCDADGQPHCAGAGQLLTTASTLGDDGVVTNDLACVLTGQATSTVPVATIYSSWDTATGVRTCLTAADPAAANAGYWDLGGYGLCDAQATPGCLGGAHPVVMASTATPTGQIKQQVACVLGGQATETPIVATMESENDTALDLNRCWTADDPEGRASGLFDLHDYSFCTEAGIPMCDDGSRKIAIASSRTAPDGAVVRYETACVLPGQPFRQNTVAGLVARAREGTDTDCADAGEPGLFDLGDYGRCSLADGATCEPPAERVVTAMTELPDGTLQTHFACVRRETLQGAAAAELSEGRTVMVFAHQDDDLLWMLPFWQYASRAYLSAAPSSPSYDPVLADLPAYYRAMRVPIWGEVSDQELADEYLTEPCERAERIDVDTVRERLRPYLDNPSIRRVVTHNPWGEYGQIQHRIVSEAVRQLAVELGLDVWVLAARVPVASGEPVEDVGPFGLETLRGVYEHTQFDHLRAAYQDTDFGLPVGGQVVDTWTWNDGKLDYPDGERTYVKIVDAGVDRIADDQDIARLVATVEPIAGCDAGL